MPLNNFFSFHDVLHSSSGFWCMSLYVIALFSIFYIIHFLPFWFFRWLSSTGFHLYCTCILGLKPSWWFKVRGVPYIQETLCAFLSLHFDVLHLPCCLSGAAAGCGLCACSASLKCPEDKSERAPLQREAGEKNREKDQGQKTRWGWQQAERQQSEKSVNGILKNTIDDEWWWKGISFSRWRQLIFWLSLRVYFKATENSTENNHNKSQGGTNEMHHPQLSLRRRTQIKDPYSL